MGKKDKVSHQKTLAKAAVPPTGLSKPENSSTESNFANSKLSLNNEDIHHGNDGSAEPIKSQDTLTGHVPLLLSILIGASVWIYLFTDYFPGFGSIIGISGVLAVVPAMRGLMTRQRQKAYTDYLDTALFQSSRSAKVYIVSLLAIAIVGFGVFKPVRFYNGAVDPLISVSYRSVFDNGVAGPWQSMRLQPGQTKREPIRRSLFGGPVRLEVRASGLPRFNRDIRGFGWPKITLPADGWLEPVLILRPDAELMSVLRNRLPRLTFSLRRANDSTSSICQEDKTWFGAPVIIGGGEGIITIPKKLKRAWQNEHAFATLQNSQRGLTLLNSGVTRRLDCNDNANRPTELLSTDEIMFKVTTGNGDLVSKGSVKIDAIGPFPMEVVARVKKR